VVRDPGQHLVSLDVDGVAIVRVVDWRGQVGLSLLTLLLQASS
jgi:hypothetical protein